MISTLGPIFYVRDIKQKIETPTEPEGHDESSSKGGTTKKMQKLCFSIVGSEK